MTEYALRALIFDLDDTLYSERDFFRSGFTVVADYLSSKGYGNSEETLRMLEYAHHNGYRSSVMQRLCADLRFPEEWVPGLVQRFREHAPNIRLADDTQAVLQSLRPRYKLGCVTDGWHDVQERKALALGVAELLDVIVFSDEFGRERWKPHPLPFRTCCERLGVLPAEALFVGDNHDRDIIGAERAGLRTIRIRRADGYFASMDSPNSVTSLGEIASLSQLVKTLEGLETQTSVEEQN